MNTGFIGLGAMGYSMAANLQRAGLLTHVYNRSQDKAARFGEQYGVAVADTPAELAGSCEVIVLCVSADQDVLTIVAQLASQLKAGQLIIDCSTVSNETAKQAADTVAAYGTSFIDCPVSGGTEGAKNGQLSLMIGASREDFERAQPIFKAIGKTINHMGPVGAGQATKAVNQIMCAGINQAVCEALNFGEALGLPLDKVVDVVSSGAAGNWFVEHRGKTMTQDSYAPGFKLALHHKDLTICESMAEQHQRRIPLATKTRQDYEPLMQEGLGDEDISALYRRRKELFSD